MYNRAWRRNVHGSITDIVVYDGTSGLNGQEDEQPAYALIWCIWHTLPLYRDCTVWRRRYCCVRQDADHNRELPPPVPCTPMIVQYRISCRIPCRRIVTDFATTEPISQRARVGNEMPSGTAVWLS